MLKKIIEHFMISDERENHEIVYERISKDAVFKGTNLWILVFAIFIASLGLNINSTAVIIGAMLISPLMGPIIGMGLGIGINDLDLLKKSAKNYSFAIAAGLFTSTIYFSLTPLNDAYSELLARTSPNFYDVLIALFGGLAGILAASSKQKGNVIPGVAIATALMPPLCTAGYGLATLNMKFILGALYLFTINTVFIALATFLTIRFLKFPQKHLIDTKADTRSQRIIMIIVVLTIIPSIYSGYLMVQQNKFTKNANLFIATHSSAEGNYLLNKEVDAQNKSITLVYGGKGLSQEDIAKIRKQLEDFGLKDAKLNVKQGFSFINEDKESGKMLLLTKTLEDKDRQLQKMQVIVDSISAKNKLAGQVFKELKIQYPEITSAIIYPSEAISDSASNDGIYTLIKIRRTLSNTQKKVMKDWLQARLQLKNVNLVIIK